jgi:hypothetical protein
MSFLESKNTSKYKGVNWYKPYKKWRACFYNGTTKHLGYFDTEEQAHEAYQKALKQYPKY